MNNIIYIERERDNIRVYMCFPTFLFGALSHDTFWCSQGLTSSPMKHTEPRERDVNGVMSAAQLLSPSSGFAWIPKTFPLNSGTVWFHDMVSASS